jgi:hypothetical protein
MRVESSEFRPMDIAARKKRDKAPRHQGTKAPGRQGNKEAGIREYDLGDCFAPLAKTLNTDHLKERQRRSNKNNNLPKVQNLREVYYL